MQLHDEMVTSFCCQHMRIGSAECLNLCMVLFRSEQRGRLTGSGPVCFLTCRAFRPSRSTVVRPVASGGGKTDLNKVGLNSIPEGVVKNNLKGISPQMEKKGWVDAQGRKGKVCPAVLCQLLGVGAGHGLAGCCF